ncbi:Hypothetical Protein FCC1311_110562 [Hondaea fermentalgiana]|uniref:Cation efflux protein transmembrane domain-containing protein n=1 Tax=Hondaea fermentalgiana TaxID=2315210 RepID=A0A2R5H346_9STRA|nr:Hypothetical Protein FCC1311_110562 [Hondaea fermentalgiana]|eukprot:GBG34834.1 Hypothetical Protein FCC1311_110562 [Hondaea fermentalgiana]
MLVHEVDPEEGGKGDGRDARPETVDLEGSGSSSKAPTKLHHASSSPSPTSSPQTPAFQVDDCDDATPPHERNMKLLALELVLFGCFAAAQLAMSLAGDSLSLLGDAACMVVDTATYGMNLVAENCKRRGIRERTRFRLEFYIPLVSVAGLVATSIYIIDQAVEVISAQIPSGPTDDKVMLIFSSVNLGIDALSVFCFVRIKGFLGFETVDRGGGGGGDDEKTKGGKAEQSNTNMCSAYTHVLADTMRSVAVIVAAVVSMSVSGVDGGLADAWAAVVVAAIIFATLIPLLRGIIQKYNQLQHDGEHTGNTANESKE